MPTPSTTTVTTPVVAPTTPQPPAWVIPDVWHEEATGLEWCDCGDHCPLTRRFIATIADNVCGQASPERITHPQVIAIAKNVWAYESVCRFFTMAIEDAAVRVNGTVAKDYPREVGLEIVKAFSNRWNGCPEEGCEAYWPGPDAPAAGSEDPTES